MAFDFTRSSVERAKEARRNGFGQAKMMQEHDLGNILHGLAAIDDDMKQHYPRISESMFKSRFLDAFAGYGESVEDNYGIYLEWLQDVAKQYNIPVHVCDDRDMSVILFTVPAMTNVKTVNPEKARNEEVQYAIQTATAMKHMQPHQWEAMLSNNLYSIFQKVYDRENAMSESQKEWMAIFERYADHFKGRTRLIQFEPTLMVGNDTDKTQTQANVSSTPVPPTSSTFVEVEEDC